MFSTWLLRSVLSGAFAILFYLSSAGIVARFWNRGVARSVVKHDFKLGIISRLWLSDHPGLRHDTGEYGIGRRCDAISERGFLYWVVSLPLYVLCWDDVFYLTHLVLHIPHV